MEGGGATQGLRHEHSNDLVSRHHAILMIGLDTWPAERVAGRAGHPAADHGGAVRGGDDP